MARLTFLSCVLGVNEGHPVSSEMRVQIAGSVEALPTHPAGQSALPIPPRHRSALRGGRRRHHEVLVAPAGPRGGRGGQSVPGPLVEVRWGVPDLVGDEAVARQRGRRREAGTAVQALLAPPGRPLRVVLGDVLQEDPLVLSGEPAGGAAEA